MTNLVRKAEKEYFQKLIEHDNNIASVWRALNVFTKGNRSTSADIPKNLTANVFNNHFLSVSESLTEPRATVYECSNLLMISANKKLAGKTQLSSHSSSFGTRQMHTEAGEQNNRLIWMV